MTERGQRPEGERVCTKIEKIPGDYRDLFLFIIGVVIIVLFLFLGCFECFDLVSLLLWEKGDRLRWMRSWFDLYQVHLIRQPEAATFSNWRRL